MALDTKEIIADATKKLLFEKKVKKLTVKDIVEECHITRQSFYYHFSGIPKLIEWILQQHNAQIFEECLRQADFEGQLRCFILIALNARPSIMRGLQTNYKEEFQRIIFNNLHDTFARLLESADIIDKNDTYEKMPSLNIISLQ